MHILIKKKKLIFNHYRIKCAVGKRGIGIKKKEGDFVTPIGLFKIKYILYRKDRVKNLKTLLKKIPITKKIGWCDDPKSKKYNQLVWHLGQKNELLPASFNLFMGVLHLKHFSFSLL